MRIYLFSCRPYKFCKICFAVLENCIYVFQELEHNIIKHSKATEALVQLRKMNSHILLVIEDKGRGMTAEKKAALASAI
jgi:signal transduction histidine kinase